MFELYAACVLNEFKKRQIEDQLSLNLRYPTAAKLRAESISICTSRFLKKDEKVLSAFWGCQSNAAAYCLAIKKSEADAFKPLRNYLKGDTDKTQERNIELLAWLIDYEPRPYQIGRNYHSPPVGMQNHRLLADQLTAYDQPITSQVAARPNWKKTLLLCTLLSVIGGGVAYLLLKAPIVKPAEDVNVIQPRVLAQSNDTQCMYWAGDCFKITDHKTIPAGKLAYRVDFTEVADFKKITKPDTITNASIGKVWYYKTATDSIEYFTAGGFHPLYRDRKLKPLTEYIVNKYIYHKIPNGRST